MPDADRCVCYGEIVPEGRQVCPSCTEAYIMTKDMGNGRNPDRIDSFLETLGRAWKRVPDWRFFQLICNIQRAMGSDAFYVEDEDAECFIKEMFQ